MEWSGQQEQALKDVGKWVRSRSAPQVYRLFGYAGTGKTTLVRDLAATVKGAVAFGAFTGKAALMMRRKGCVGASTIHSLIYKLDDEQPTEEPSFTLNPDAGVKDAKLIAIDECFVGQTLVDTPMGLKRIDAVQPGDLIFNASGVDRVLATSRKREKEVVQVDFGGTPQFCSRSHPFFTSRGLVNAGDLRYGDLVVETAEAMRLLRRNNHPEIAKTRPPTILYRELFDALVAADTRVSSRHLHEGPRPEVWRGSEAVSERRIGRGSQADRESQDLKSDLQSGGAEEDQLRACRHGSQATDTGRERARDSVPATRDCKSPWEWMVDELSTDHGAWQISGANALQTECSQLVDENRHRSGRRQSYGFEGASGRPQKGNVPGFQRVESVQAVQPSDPRLDQFRDADGELYLYDLQADRHASFSVGGILVHNCSMVDEQLARDLLSFGVKVLVIGDPAQLPPVKGAGYFTSATPDTMLTEVHRQARDNPIIRMSMTIREGGRLERGTYGDSRVISREEITSDDVLNADQVIVGINKTRIAYNRRIRKLRGFETDMPELGDRLVCLRNNREKKLLNGGLWNVVARKKEKGGYIPMHVMAEDSESSEKPTSISVLEDYFLGDEKNIAWERARQSDSFTFGYALTAHKSQGSQWENVVVFDESRAFREDAARWRYTAITRASETITVVS